MTPTKRTRPRPRQSGALLRISEHLQHTPLAFGVRLEEIEAMAGLKQTRRDYRRLMPLAGLLSQTGWWLRAAHIVSEESPGASGEVRPLLEGLLTAVPAAFGKHDRLPLRAHIVISDARPSGEKRMRPLFEGLLSAMPDAWREHAESTLPRSAGGRELAVRYLAFRQAILDKAAEIWPPSVVDRLRRQP